MIQIQLYNIIAVIIGFLFIFTLIYENKDGISIYSIYMNTLIIISAIIFYAIYGGIFWW